MTRSPFFFIRLAMFLAVVVVIGIVVALFVYEGQREDVGKTSTEEKIPTQFRDADDTIERGTVDDILIRINKIPPLTSAANYILVAPLLKDKIKLYRALCERESELDPGTRNIVFRGLLKSQLELHTLNLFEGVEDTTTENDLVSSAREIINANDVGVGKDAQTTLTAMKMLETFDKIEKEGELNSAKSGINDLVRKYPDDREVAESLYFILSQFGTESRHYETAMELYEHINAIFMESKDEKVKLIGNTNHGRILMIQNGILNLKSQLNFFRGDDETVIIENIRKLLAIDFPMSPTVAKVIFDIAIQLEQWNNNESALTVYQMLSKRLEKSSLAGKEQDIANFKKEVDRGVKRMQAKGKQANFPDVMPGKNNLVLFVNDSEAALNVVGTLANLRIVSANQDLNVILVSLSATESKLEQFIQSKNLKDLTVIHDPDRTSVYYDFYPTKFIPCVIIIARDGTALDVNVDLTRLSEFLKALTESE